MKCIYLLSFPLLLSQKGILVLGDNINFTRYCYIEVGLIVNWISKNN